MCVAAGERSLRSVARAQPSVVDQVQRLGRGMGAHQRGHARHPGAAEGVEYQIAGVSVVQDAGGDALRRDLGMVGVGVVDRCVLVLNLGLNRGLRT